MAMDRNSVVLPRVLSNALAIYQHELALYRCDICIIDLENRQNLVYHFKTYHKALCMICEEDIGYDETYIEDHIQIEHDVYLCNICHEYFRSLPELEEHYKNPDTHIHRCKLCCKDFPTSNEFWHHCFLQHRSNCPICTAFVPSQFANKQQWDDHLKLIHQLFPCPSCYNVLYSENLLLEHINNIHRVRCAICKEALVTQDDMEAHLNMVHQIKCLLCYKFFQTETNLKIHHDMEHTFKCTICGIVLNNDVQMKRHEKAVHQMKCEVCNVVVNSSNMQVHFNAMHQISCDFCDKVCTSLAELQIHYEIVHEMPLMMNIKDKKIYNCTVCETAFLNEIDLVEHYQEQHVEE